MGYTLNLYFILRFNSDIASKCLRKQLLTQFVYDVRSIDLVLEKKIQKENTGADKPVPLELPCIRGESPRRSGLKRA